MIIRSILKCVIVLTLTQYNTVQCDSDIKHNREASGTTSSSISNGARMISSGEIVTPSDNSSSLDKRRNDKREFPSPSKSHETLDTTYLDIDYDDSEIMAASATELPACILSRSEFYLSWWVDENGALKLPTVNRDGKSPGFADLSLNFHTQDAIFRHVSHMTTENPSDVIVVHCFFCIG